MNSKFLRQNISFTKKIASTIYLLLIFLSFFPTDQLKKHATKHDLDQGYNCELCGYHFMAKSALRNHLKTIHATTPKYHKCDLCDYQTMRLGNFQRHVRSKHEVRVSFSKQLQEKNLFFKFLRNFEFFSGNTTI